MTSTTRPSIRKERPPRLGPSEHSLLGLLAEAGTGGIHGYDLARQFTHGALGEIIRLESGMLYHHLKKLERYGMITTQVQHQLDRPDRRLHTLTDVGRQQLDSWLEAPVRATREIRLDFLLKLFFTRRLASSERLKSLVEQQRSVLANLSGSLKKQVHEPVAHGDALERRMVLRLRLAQTEAALDWLDSLLPMEDDA